jgi:predicted GNAT superfamily acetyltransferase
MMGVLPEYRNAGVGRSLKLAQRMEALERGIELVEWTFDPLELKNAFFNIERLGAVVSRYVLNQYGVTSSHLHGGLPTDRCIASWHLRSARVEAILSGQQPERGVVRERISIPADIADIRRDRPEEARRIQADVSEQFLTHLRNGLHVTGFERQDAMGTYLFTEGM